MTYLKSIIIFAFFLIALTGEAQIFLRLDIPDDPQSLRFFPDSEFEIKTTRLPDTWIKKKVVSFIPETKTIIFDQDFLKLEDITAIRINNRTPRAIGLTFQTFGTAWLGYGAIAYATGGEVSQTDALIGAGAFASGWLLRKLGKYKVYDLSLGYKLHMIDVRFPPPPDGINRP